MTCFHCEAAPALPGGVLCGSCSQVKNLRVLYRTAGRNPTWDGWIRRLASRARQRLPLFGEGGPPVRPLTSAEPSIFGRMA